MIILIAALAMLATAVAGGVSLASHSEVRIADAHRRALQLGYAAESAAARVAAALEDVVDWRFVPGAFTTGRLQASSEVEARTVSMNRALQARFPLGGDTPRWRVVSAASEADYRWVVWVADDPADGDGNPDEDTNGLIVVRAEAVRTAGAMRTVDVHLARSGAVVRQLSWREVW